MPSNHLSLVTKCFGTTLLQQFQRPEAWNYGTLLTHNSTFKKEKKTCYLDALF